MRARTAGAAAARLDKVARAAAAIRGAEALFVTCGAGMGVDSGLPDFRGDEGFWKAYPPMSEKGLSFSQCADPVHFQTDPEFAWGFYGHRMKLYQETQPGLHFEALLRLFGRTPSGGFVFTSNVDGQFQKAGFDPLRIHECHGSIHYLQDVHGLHGGGIVGPVDQESLQLKIDPETFRAELPLPTVRGPPDGGGDAVLARPNILMFNDCHWLSERTNAQRKAMNEWLGRLSRDGPPGGRGVRPDAKVVVIDIGSGTAVPTARIMGAKVAGAFDSTLIRINPRESSVDVGYGSVGPGKGIAFAEGALTVLADIEKQLEAGSC
jgi:NAD-dependent SIR2 family protein deacetylase